ncbi:MAG: hypothetical protein WCR70_06150 [Sphaerochaetaceae bacterium]
MAKALIIFITSLALLCSCNLDSSTGIFHKVSNSVPTTENTIIESLGYSGSTAWYLTGNGIYTKAQGASEQAYLQNSSIPARGARVLEAAFAYGSATDIVYSGSLKINSTDIDTEHTMLFKALSTDTYYTFPSRILAMTKNGYVILSSGTAMGIYKNNDPSAALATISTALVPGKVLESGNSLLIMDSTQTKAWIFDSSAIQELSEYHDYVGFQVYDAGKALLVDDSLNLYKLDGKRATDTLKDLDTFSSSSQMRSFKVSASQVVFKTDSYFDKLDITSDGATLTSISSGYADEIEDLNILGIHPIAEGSTYLVTTQSSGLFIIDVLNNSKSEF